MTGDMLGVEFVLDSLSQNKDEIYKGKKKRILAFPTCTERADLFWCSVLR